MSSSSKTKKPAFAAMAAKKPQTPQKAQAKPQAKPMPFKQAAPPAKSQPAQAGKAKVQAKPVQPQKSVNKQPQAKPAAINVSNKNAFKPKAPQPKQQINQKSQPKQPVQVKQPNAAVKQQSAKPSAANNNKNKPVVFKTSQPVKTSHPINSKPAVKQQPAAARQALKPQVPASKNAVRPVQQANVSNKNAFQPKQQMHVKPQSQQKIQPQKEAVKKIQQPEKNKPAVEPRKGAMTPDKAKVQTPVKTTMPQHVTENKPAVHTAEFSRETLALLFKAAKKASEHAYAPYSHFKVGAVLLLEDGRGDESQISAYTGCNVENASYGLTCCAERIAIYKAVSDGNKKFKAMVLYASSKKPVSPCGACRQVLAEFAPPDMKVYSIGQFKDEDVSKTPYAVYSVAELLPHGFKASDFIEKK